MRKRNKPINTVAREDVDAMREGRQRRSDTWSPNGDKKDKRKQRRQKSKDLRRMLKHLD